MVGVISPPWQPLTRPGRVTPSAWPALAKEGERRRPTSPPTTTIFADASFPAYRCVATLPSCSPPPTHVPQLCMMIH